MRYRIFVVMGAAAAGAACFTVPALARGSGGHGGFAASSAVIGHGARGRAAFVGHRAVSATRGAAAAGLHRSPVIGRVPAPIRPEVINLPDSLGTGAIVPPFTGTPFVPPFGTGASYVALPVVITPYAGVPSFAAAGTSRIAGSGGTLPVADTGLGAPGVSDANPADPNTLHGTCHPEPHGYHCDWSS
jgi:hypothetical protein